MLKIEVRDRLHDIYSEIIDNLGYGLYIICQTLDGDRVVLSQVEVANGDYDEMNFIIFGPKDTEIFA